MTQPKPSAWPSAWASPNKARHTAVSARLFSCGCSRVCHDSSMYHLYFAVRFYSIIYSCAFDFICLYLTFVTRDVCLIISSSSSFQVPVLFLPATCHTTGTLCIAGIVCGIITFMVHDLHISDVCITYVVHSADRPQKTGRTRTTTRERSGGTGELMQTGKSHQKLMQTVRLIFKESVCRK
jgi:hypothetical protein